MRSLEADTDRRFAPVLSLLPADVGFDLRTVEIPVILTEDPSPVNVLCLVPAGKENRTTWTVPELVPILHQAEYRITIKATE